MALAVTNPTVSDWLKTLDPDGTPARTIELLKQRNDMLDDVLVTEGNLPIGHQVTVQTALPESFWRLANVGTTPSKDSTAQFTEAAGTVENWSVIDRKVAELNGGAAEYRARRAAAHVESLKQELMGTLLYGSASNPEEIIGLANRYSSTTAGNGANVKSAGGTGSDNTSIWLIGWGEQAIHTFFPKGSNGAGIDYKDYGLQVVSSSISGAQLEAYRARWSWDIGLAVADWRYAFRICNIDVSNLKNKTAAANLIELMIQAMHSLPDLQSVRPAFYMNRGVARMLDVQRRDAVLLGGGLDYKNVDGRMVYDFRGVPVRICDQILETESLVS